MRKVLGLDLSMTSTGWFLQDGQETLNYGSFKTKPKDGLVLERLMLQRDRVRELITNNKIEYVGIEAPLKHTFSTETLFALHQFVLEVCYNFHLKVVYITPAQIKTYAVDDGRADKNAVVFATKKALNLKKQRINNDECDAYWISKIASTFWQYYNEEIPEEELSIKEKHIIIKTKSGRPGLIKKENDSFFIFKNYIRKDVKNGQSTK